MRKHLQDSIEWRFPNVLMQNHLGIWFLLCENVAVENRKSYFSIQQKNEHILTLDFIIYALHNLH